MKKLVMAAIITAATVGNAHAFGFGGLGGLIPSPIPQIEGGATVAVPGLGSGGIAIKIGK